MQGEGLRISKYFADVICAFSVPYIFRCLAVAEISYLLDLRDLCSVCLALFFIPQFGPLALGSERPPKRMDCPPPGASNDPYCS